MKADQTRPVDVHPGAGGAPEKLWQSSDSVWSFGWRSRRLFAAGSRDQLRTDPPLPQKNLNGAETTPVQRVTVPNRNPVAPPDQRWGQKSWQALSQWEGIVEQVGVEGFRLRLTPLVEGRPDFTRVEFADFGFDELAYESDRQLVVRDAVFYWTVGRRKDEAGTVSNQSLVRVRRQALPSAWRRKLAQQEVASLLAESEADE